MREQGAYGIPRRKVFEFEEDNKRMEMEMLRLDGLFFFSNSPHQGSAIARSIPLRDLNLCCTPTPYSLVLDSLVFF